MNYIEFFIRLIAFAVTLFLLLEFIVACEMDTWKAAVIFIGISFLVIIFFFLTKQHIMSQCPHCLTKKRNSTKLAKKMGV